MPSGLSSRSVCTHKSAEPIRETFFSLPPFAAVQGGGSGIGRALVEALACQGLNVVVVSLPDKFLGETMAFLQNNFPGFIACVCA